MNIVKTNYRNVLEKRKRRKKLENMLTKTFWEVLDGLRNCLNTNCCRLVFRTAL